MSDEEKEARNLAKALAKIGSITASVLPMAQRMARAEADKMFPEGDEEQKEVSATRLVALTLMVNAMLAIERTTQDDKVDEVIDENTAYARSLIRGFTRGCDCPNCAPKNAKLEKQAEEKGPSITAEQFLKMFGPQSQSGETE